MTDITPANSRYNIMHMLSCGTIKTHQSQPRLDKSNFNHGVSIIFSLLQNIWIFLKKNKDFPTHLCMIIGYIIIFYPKYYCTGFQKPWAPSPIMQFDSISPPSNLLKLSALVIYWTHAYNIWWTWFVNMLCKQCTGIKHPPITSKLHLHTAVSPPPTKSINTHFLLFLNFHILGLE